MINPIMRWKLKALREFQREYPGSHVGGSIGLLMQGIDLKRDLTLSDLDVTTPVDSFTLSNGRGGVKGTSSTDIDYCKMSFNPKGLCVKIDIRIDRKAQYKTIRYRGFRYRVSLIEDIIGWKILFSQRGSIKHSDDLEVLSYQLGKEYVDKLWKKCLPGNSTTPYQEDLYDDLPF